MATTNAGVFTTPYDELKNMKGQLSHSAYTELKKMCDGMPPDEEDLSNAKVVRITFDELSHFLEEDDEAPDFTVNLTEYSCRKGLYMITNDEACGFKRFTDGKTTEIPIDSLKLMQQKMKDENGYIKTYCGDLYRISNIEIIQLESEKKTKHQIADELFHFKNQFTDYSYLRLMNFLIGRNTVVDVTDAKIVTISGDEIFYSMEEDDGEINLNVTPNCKAMLTVTDDPHDGCDWQFFANKTQISIARDYLKKIAEKMSKGKYLKAPFEDTKLGHNLYRIIDIEILH